jgi:ankyrin repeat protein
MKFRESEATDPRDTIYALLGISSDMCDSDFLRPDYTRTLQQVIRDTTSFLLCYNNQGNSLHDLPDWKLPEFLQNLDSLSNAVFKWALKTGHEATLKLMLKRDDVDVNWKDENGVTSLSWAAAKGYESIVGLLLTHNGKGADVNAQDGKYGNVLRAASAEGYDKIVELLFSNSADVNTQDEKYGYTLYTISMENYDKIIELLFNKSVDVNA